MGETRPGFMTTLETEGISLTLAQETAIRKVADNFFNRSAGVKIEHADVREFFHGPAPYEFESDEVRLQKWREKRLKELEQKRATILDEQTILLAEGAVIEKERNTTLVEMGDLRNKILALEKKAREERERARPPTTRTRRVRPPREEESEDITRLARETSPDDEGEMRSAPTEESAPPVPEVPPLTLEEIELEHDRVSILAEQRQKEFFDSVNNLADHLKKRGQAIKAKTDKRASDSFKMLTRDLPKEDPLDKKDPQHRVWLNGTLRAYTRMAAIYEDGLKEIQKLKQEDKISRLLRIRQSVTSRESEIEQLFERAKTEKKITPSARQKNWYNTSGLQGLHETVRKAGATLPDFERYLSALESYLEKLRKLLPEFYSEPKP